MKLKNLACLTFMTITASLAHAADKPAFSKFDFSQYVAFAEVCSELVPAKKAFYMSSRYEFEAKNSELIQSAAKDAEYDRMIHQYKNMMRAADTVYGVELCEQMNFSQSPLRLKSSKDGDS